ncbi:MalY/PatB family protein [Roseibium litorale]|uniref:cysteine-S-conjugate beta-lyase n=1 Tax=Roseibium litorale TaxID=2803841 RepID=A0ABR9CQS9_9HYPH|nr:MalY/PatB family protein [Roseibium litorale]MBD8892616.1 pyridoxal phosphate-dependent aminotransferase [Roseibium litorale]
MNFDEIIDRRGTHCSKWDMMEPLYGLSANDGLPMWVADMDFRPPAVVQLAVERMARHGIYGYFGDDRAYKNAICWWMMNRQGWELDPASIFTTHGLVNGTALCIDTWTQPGDAVVLMTPVYHAFARVVRAAGREIRELPLAQEDGRYRMDFDNWHDRMTGREKLLLLCSPHNPGGRVWTAEELRGVADFAERHGLIVVSDEIHADLVFPGYRHIPMAIAAPDISTRLVMMTAATKTFNIAGAHVGNVIIPDQKLREDFAKRHAAMGTSPNSFGIEMVTAAYSPEGAEWVDALMQYLDGNRKAFDAGIARIPGLLSMPLEATYLAWVDGSDACSSGEEFVRRVQQNARIAVNHGPTFGTGGENFLRFNFACPRPMVEEAVKRLRAAFADLQ